MRYDSLRNPELYRLLSSAFPSRRGVTVHRQGQAGEFGKGKVASGNGYGRYRLEKQGAITGEEYSVSCPFCNDTKQRMYVNHLYGTVDPYTKQQILWLWHCYNEECQADYQNRLALARKVFDGDRSVLHVNQDVAVQVVKKTVRLPGAMQDLLVLAKGNPNHPSVQWCYGRGYQLDELGPIYSVGSCTMEASYGGSYGETRIVVPWYFRRHGITELGGWTARRVHDAETPKWVHGAPTGNVIYGLGNAATYKTVVIVEGPGDKWSVGPQGSAVLGKHVKPQKAALIARALRPNMSKHVVIVLLDPDMDVVQKRKGLPHHIDTSVRELKKVLSCPVLGVYLPSSTDPGSLCREYLWDYMTFSARKQGVVISQLNV